MSGLRFLMMMIIVKLHFSLSHIHEFFVSSLGVQLVSSSHLRKKLDIFKMKINDVICWCSLLELRPAFIAHEILELVNFNLKIIVAPVSCRRIHHYRRRDPNDREFHRSPDHSNRLRPSSCWIVSRRSDYELAHTHTHTHEIRLKYCKIPSYIILNDQ